MRVTRSLSYAAALGMAICVTSPSLADVKSGVEAWERGDYSAAVAQWRDLARQGDADAQFNMAQAYRLGRGVERDAAQAEAYYAKASAQGHLQAGDNYGLLLFQNGRRETALPYIQAAAGRGDPRAQYLLGISHFNGDLVEKDWVKAYALLTLANSAGLPQAKNGIAKMDDFIPLAQRQEAQGAAQSMKLAAEAAKVSQLAAADLGSAVPQPAPAQPAAATAPARNLPATASAYVPDPVPNVRIAPSIAAAQAAVEEASRVLGTSSPAAAGADFAGGTPIDAPTPDVAATPVTTPAPATRPRPSTARSVSRAAAQAASGGPWKVQLGAFAVSGNADRLWAKVSGNAALSGAKKLTVKAGRITRLQAGGFGSRSAAQAACNTLKRSGQACLVTK